MATVTANPARHVGLTDRGVIARGKRADLVRFAIRDDMAVAGSVWSLGRQVA
ncbi:MAG: hypothetical protein AAFO86_04670 [Pseudomonadota bacterium]